MKKYPLLFVACLLASPLARAQVELVYKTPKETLLVTNMQATLPLRQSEGRDVRMPAGGRLELREAKAFSPLQAMLTTFYSVYHAPREPDGSGRVLVDFGLDFEASDHVGIKGMYIAYQWEVPGRSVRLFARQFVVEPSGKAFLRETIALRPGEEAGFLRVYLFHEGKSIAGLTKREVKPASALEDFVALRSAVDAGNRQEVVAWAGRHNALAVPNLLLRQLAHWGDVVALDAILTQTASRQNLSGRDGGDVLMAAVASDRLEATALILKNGVKATQPETGGKVPMRKASYNNSPEMIGLLLRAGAPEDEKNFDGNTPLALAMKDGSPDIVDVLLTAGAKWPKSEKMLARWLTNSVLQGCDANVLRLLAQGVDPNAHDEEVDPRLIAAVRSNNVAMVEALLKAGAKPNVDNVNGMNAVMYAAQAGNQAIVERLIAAGADAGKLDKANQSAASFALAEGHEDTARWLLTQYTPRPADLSFLLRVALLKDKGGWADELRAKGARLNPSDPQIDEIMDEAIRQGDVATVREALAGGYDANKQVQPGWTVGGVAQRYGQTEIFEVLKTAASGALVVKVPAVSNLPIQVVGRWIDFTPEDLQASGLYGEARIDIMIDGKGHPKFPKVVPGADPRLSRYALIRVMAWSFNSLEGNDREWRRAIVPIVFSKPHTFDGDDGQIYYPWELGLSAVADSKAESWGSVRTQPVSLVASIFVVSNEGKIVNPRIAGSSVPDVNAQVLDAVRGWKYRPAVKAAALVWSYQSAYVVMPGLRRIQPGFLYPIDDLPAGAERPGLVKAGSGRALEVDTPAHFAAVLLRFTVGADGKVSAISALAATDERAVQAAIARCERAVYEPGRVDGKPVAMEVIQCIPFDDSVETLWDGP